jgi:hypothetical protein
MRIGAKIMLSTELGAAREGLAGLADGSWLMNLLPQQEAHMRHPAGKGRPGLPGPGGGSGLVAVTFGTPPVAPGSAGALPVHWESLEPGDALAVLLAGDITLAPAAAEWNSTLALAGFCQLLPAAEAGSGYEQARLHAVREAARSFITSVAVAVAGSAGTGSAGTGQEPQPPGPAWSWLTGYRTTA